VDRVDVGGQIPVVDAEGTIQDGHWVPPADAAAPMSYALEPGQQRQVRRGLSSCEKHRIVRRQTISSRALNCLRMWSGFGRGV
jgi:hypothetical protein